MHKHNETSLQSIADKRKLMFTKTRRVLEEVETEYRKVKTSAHVKSKGHKNKRKLMAGSQM